MREAKNDKMETENHKIKAEILSWIKTIGIAVVIAVIVSKGLIVNAKVPTPSMENTILVNDRLIANRLAYIFNEPERGDIVVFVSLEDDSKLYVKRLIGLPGDEIVINNGVVFVNDCVIEEKYLKEEMYPIDYGTYKVPKDHYFFLGDNRNHSSDARLWDNPYISKDEIVGKAVLKYFPKVELLNE